MSSLFQVETVMTLVAHNQRVLDLCMVIGEGSDVGQDTGVSIHLS